MRDFAERQSLCVMMCQSSSELSEPPKTSAADILRGLYYCVHDFLFNYISLLLFILFFLNLFFHFSVYGNFKDALFSLLVYVLS